MMQKLAYKARLTHQAATKHGSMSVLLLVFLGPPLGGAGPMALMLEHES
jgi:hypothetical protein